MGVLSLVLQFDATVCVGQTFYTTNNCFQTRFRIIAFILRSLNGINKIGFAYIGTVLHATSCCLRTCAAVLAAHAYILQNLFLFH
jgi:hypothetical protein